MERHRNDGLRKICICPRRTWAKCSHSWHFSFKWKDQHYRFSLDKHAGEHIDSKTAAEDLADDLRKAIKAGEFGQPAPRAEMTLRQLADAYLERYVQVERPAALEDFRGGLRVICKTLVPKPAGAAAAFGDWRLVDIVTDTVERYREARRAAGAGPGGTNRSLSRLRAVFGWAVRVGYLDATPFKRHGQTVVKLSREIPRGRRLQDGEDAALLQACGTHLRAVVETALETGMRQGEILSLQWSQVEGMQLRKETDDTTTIAWAPRAVLVLPPGKTKTQRERRIPVSSRLRLILEMRRFDPAGEPLSLTANVFGNEIGQQVKKIKRAWMSAVLKAHGHKVALTATANLTRECRNVLEAIDLHFHDLRREAGSRWLEGGVPLHIVRDWLGHANVSQTSTYLSGTVKTQHDAMSAFEARRDNLQELATSSQTGGRKSPRTTKRPERKPNKTAGEHDQTIM